MPTYRAIQLSIISAQGLKPHPEFPHPDSAQFEVNIPLERAEEVAITSPYRTPERTISLPVISPSMFSANGKADKLLGRQPTVSVYIPSIAATRFWIRYKITPDHPPVPYFFFKLYMNGRPIVSWGVNPEIQPEGQVMRAPFQSKDRYAFRDDGDVYKHEGLEVRPFWFGGEHDPTNIKTATEGGCIEIVVYRSRGKRRRMPEPLQYRDQEKYGLLLPEGRVDFEPQGMRFYEWVLIDPRDSPYARFCFFYRSWDQLQSLQLIPQDHPRNLGSPTPSEESMNETGLVTRNSVEDLRERDTSMLSERTKPWSAAVAMICNDQDDESYTADDSDEGGESAGDEDSEPLLPTPQPLKKHSPTHRIQRTLTSSFSSQSLSAYAKKSKKIWDRTRRPLPNPMELFPTDLSDSDPTQSDRPLPDPTQLPQNQLPSSDREQNDRPLPQPPTGARALSRSSRRSATSATPTFIAPSLRSYFDDDGNSEHDIGVATAIKVTDSPSSNYDASEGYEQPSFASFTSAAPVYHKPNASSLQLVRNQDPARPPPEAYFSPSITSTFPNDMPPSFPSFPTMDLEDPFGPSENADRSQETTLGSSPSNRSVHEWLRKTPSPTKMHSMDKPLPDSPRFAESTVASRAKLRSKTPDPVRIREDSSPEDPRSRGRTISSFWRRRTVSRDAGTRRAGPSWF